MNHIFSSQRFVSSAFAIPKGVRDLVVIGGGSGGLSLAKESSRLGASVTLFDYVQVGEPQCTNTFTLFPFPTSNGIETD